MATAAPPITAEVYGRLPDNGQPTELVRGQIVPIDVPYPRHGEAGSRISYLLQQYVQDRDLGRGLCNDSGVITQRHPDTVRGADVDYYSYARVPKGPLPSRYLTVVPELIFEVRSPDDRWREILAKVSEYLKAGVLRVCVADAERETVTVYSSDDPEERLSADQILRLPDILPDFEVPVRRLFE